MYQKYFSLEGKPFTITPDPRFLFMSERHREALAHLVYGLGEGGGFVQLTGEVGTGKTTLCRCLLDQLPQEVDLALILNPRLTAFELVATICDELRIPYPEGTDSIKVLVDRLNEHLLRTHAAGRRTVLIIDEAQNLSGDALEQVRLLTNLETADAKLLQIILIGQPELKEMLERRDMRQLAQRITARYHLLPLSPEETRAYIAHRLRVCGATRPLFTRQAIEEIQRFTGGIPRLINVLCDRALLGAYVEERPHVDRKVVQRAAREVLPPAGGGRDARRAGVGLAVAAVLLLGLGWTAWVWRDRLPGHTDEASAMTGAPEPVAAGEQAPGEAVAATVLVPGTAASAGDAVDDAQSSSASSEAAASPVMDAADDRAQLADGAGAVAEPPEAPALTPVDVLLRSLTDAGAPGRLWARMFELWGVAPGSAAIAYPCPEAERHGLACLERSGSWKLLLSFNRPAVLELVSPEGRLVPVLLEAVEGERARVSAGGESVWVSVAGLEAYWQGRFRLLWRPPLSIETLRPGMRHKGVLWLRARLDQVLGPAVPAEDSMLFDQALAQRVRTFQAREGLRPDGVVGAQTLVRLNSLDPALPEPLLVMAASQTDTATSHVVHSGSP